MNLAVYYARALFALMEEKPKDAALYLHNLGLVLTRRGHDKLLPRIFSEYRKLALGKERAAQWATSTSGQERTRVLLQLYRKLIAAA